jgi:hypothetical protein
MPKLPIRLDARSAFSATDQFERALIEATSGLNRYALNAIVGRTKRSIALMPSA